MARLVLAAALGAALGACGLGSPAVTAPAAGAAAAREAAAAPRIEAKARQDLADAAKAAQEREQRAESESQ